MLNYFRNFVINNLTILMPLSDSKYYPEKFYIKFDAENIDQLVKLDPNNKFSIELGVFIHEYYHYLNNISTFQGIRDFNLIFGDLIRIITILQRKGLRAFPINQCYFEEFQYLKDYWKDAIDLYSNATNYREIEKKVTESMEKKIHIKDLQPEKKDLKVKISPGRWIDGSQILQNLLVESADVPPFTIRLTNAEIDEFMCSAIDEFLFQTDSCDNQMILEHPGRTFYPYKFFDELLSHYNVDLISAGGDARHQIILAYKALHSPNPPVRILKLIKAVRGHERDFIDNPFDFLETSFPSNFSKFEEVIDYLYKLISECEDQNRINLARATNLIYETAKDALSELKNDPYFFIRPLIENDLSTIEGRQNYLDFLKILLKRFDKFLQLKDGELKGAFSHPEKNHLAFIIIIHEILRGAENNKIIKREQKNRDIFELEGELDYDNIEKFDSNFPLTNMWQIALNDLSFYKLYVEYNQYLSTKKNKRQS